MVTLSERGYNSLSCALVAFCGPPSAYGDVRTNFFERAHKTHALVATLKHQQLHPEPALHSDDLKTMPGFHYHQFPDTPGASLEFSPERQYWESLQSAARERDAPTVDRESANFPAEQQTEGD